MISNNLILVTGGTGFIGFALIKRLIASGYSVRIITRGLNYDKAFENFLSETSKSRLEIFVGDISKSSDIKQAFENISYVFHVAALVNSVLPYSKFEAANVIATKNICELCLAFKVHKLVYISTCDVFGLPEKDTIFTESSHYKNWSEPYADTKIKASQLVKDFQQHGLKSTIFYPGWVYGPGDKAFMPSILKQLQSGFMPIWDGGNYKIGPVYIDDLIDAIVMALQNKNTTNEDFLILDDSPQTNLEDICNLLGVLFNVKYKAIHLPYWLAYIISWTSQKLCQMKLIKNPIASTTDVKSLGYNFKYSTNKAKSFFDWSVTEEFNSGLLKWKSWYEKN
ncbi:MAG: NAD(P)-dependent oxidoreductase [Bacteroidales bacterium]|nr:NAD(P)-dependent oxidoreductase [Bacteroidales bacterium]